jgi:hypothetical protein
MSDFFADKQYQSLDWISQAVEPWDWEIIPAFNSFPSCTVITPELIQAVIDSDNAITRYNLEFSIGNFIAVIAKQVDNPLPGLIAAAPAQIAARSIKELFKLEMQDPYGTTFNAVDLSFNKPVHLAKTKEQIDDKTCQEIVSVSVNDLLYDARTKQDGCLQRMGEILDLATSQKIVKGRIHRRDQFIVEIRTIFAEDKWRIRNVALATNIVAWAVDYVNTGNLAAMANFAKVKVMTHAGKAIYSIQEVE